MFSLFRLNEENGELDELTTVYSWREMCHVVERQFYNVTVIEKNDFFFEAVSVWYSIPKDYEFIFRDEDKGGIYVIYRIGPKTWDRYEDRYDDPYSDYYDDVDNQTDSYYAQQRRELERWEDIFHDPELLMRRYFPREQPLVLANKKNEWYVGWQHPV